MNSASEKAARWQSSDEYHAEIDRMRAAVMRKSRICESESQTAAIFENELYSVIKSKTGMKLDYSEEKSFDNIKHKFTPFKKRRTKTGRFGDRVNSLVIEYIHNSKLKTEKQFEDAAQKTVDYLKALFTAEKNEYSAVLTDGISIAYFVFADNDVRYSSPASLSSNDIDNVIKAIVHNGEKRFVPENIVNDFSISKADGSVSKSIALALYESLKKHSAGRALMQYKEWKRLFLLSDDNGKGNAIVKRRAELSSIFSDTIDSPEAECIALYALQTSYAIIAKLIACKAADKPVCVKKYYCDPADIASDKLRRFFEKMESGFLEKNGKVLGFSGGDVYSWYADKEQWSDCIRKSVLSAVKSLDRYSSFSFNITYRPIDVLKDLYMGIIPKSIRHSKGEYFTPGWMADYVVNKSLKYVSNENWKAVDPCCGSRTFIIALIKKIAGDTNIRALSEADKRKIRSNITDRVYGIDINPLSVLSAKVGYYLALLPFGDLSGIEIPVYLGDSAIIPEGNFALTALPRTFDLIVGNPPWVKWEHLPAIYKDKMKELCNIKHMFSNDGQFGGTQLNICALIANVTASNWLSRNGVLAFLMPDGIMSQNSYEGFRNFYIDHAGKERLYLQQIDKWEAPLRPFACGNCAIAQDFNTYYYSYAVADYKSGIPVQIITREKTVKDSELNSCYSFKEAEPHLIFRKGTAVQLTGKSTAFSYISDKYAFSKIIGESAYLYRTGVEFTPQELYMLTGIGTSLAADHYLFKPKKFRLTKFKIDDTPENGWDLPVKLIYPIVTGPDIEPFGYKKTNDFCILPYDKKDTSKPIGTEKMIAENKELFEYLFRHKELTDQQSEKSKMMHRGKEFYALSKIGPYTFAENIVAVRDNSKFCACVINKTATPWNVMKQTVCVKHTIIISQDKTGRCISRDEANYICGILNSDIVIDYIHSIFKTTGFSLNKSNLYLPLYDKESPLHRKIGKMALNASRGEGDIALIQKRLSELYLKLCGKRDK